MDRFPGRIAYEPQPIWLSASRFRIFSGILKAWNIRPARWKKREGEFTVDMRKLMVRYLSEVFVAFLVVAFVRGAGLDPRSQRLCDTTTPTSPAVCGSDVF